MQVRVETLADLKRIKFNPFDTVFCVETEKEYFLNLSGGSLTPDDEDIVQAIHGANARYVAMAAQASGGGGGGGSAYPEPLLFVTEDTDLTEDDQGFLYIVGGKPKLPATAANGTTFKFGGSPNDMIIDTNGNTVAGYGNDANLKIGSQLVHLVAINIPGPMLVWMPANRRYIDNYYADAAYAEGDMVESDGVRYLCISDYSVGDALTDPVYWLSLGGGSESSGVLTGSDFAFTSGGPADFLDAAYQVSRNGKQTHLRIAIAYDDPGSAPTDFVIQLPEGAVPAPAVLGATNLDTIQGAVRMFTGSVYITGNANLIYGAPSGTFARVSIRPYDGAWTGKAVMNIVVDITYMAA